MLTKRSRGLATISDPTLLEQTARALFQKASLAWGDEAAVIRNCDELIAAFSGSSMPALQEIVAEARLLRAGARGQQLAVRIATTAETDPSGALAAIDELVALHGDAEMIGPRTQVARALSMKATIQVRRNEADAARQTLDLLLQRLQDATGDELRTIAATNLVVRIAMTDGDDPEVRKAMIRDASERYGDLTDPGVVQLLALARQQFVEAPTPNAEGGEDDGATVVVRVEDDET